MRVLAFDAGMGASGDMLLAALVDAGADPDVLTFVEDALDVEFDVARASKAAIEATTVDVRLTGAAVGSTDHEHVHDESGHDHDGGHSHGNSRDDHEHTQDDHEHAPVHAEGHGPHRSYPEVRSIVDSLDLPPAVEADALAIFERLGEAEATVHGVDLEATHFHEVGADDAIADVVGAALLIADLDPDRVVTTPVATGGGRVSMSHGEYPVPAPAVAEIVTRASWSIVGGPVDRELLTPTGAAILAHVAEGVDSLPTLSVEATGYGAGDADCDPHPNVLRVLVGDGEGSGLHREDVAVLETNVDDVTSEVLGDLQRSLAGAGARDVSILPTTMKKARPGHLVKVVCRPADRERVARTLAEETGTLGVRDAGVTHRWIANRSIERVSIDLDGETYEVRVKVATDEGGRRYDVSAEFEDAAEVAASTGRPTREVIRRAETAIHDDGPSTD